MIEQVLKKLDLGDKEIAVFLALVEHGKSTHAFISRVTKINRSTVYAVANELQSKGIVEEDISGKIMYLNAIPVEKLGNILKKEKRELKNKEDLVDEAVKELSQLPKSKHYSVPKIRFIEGDEVGDFLYERMEDWGKSTKSIDNACWGFQDHSFAENYQEWIGWAVKKYGLDVNLLSNRSDIEKKLKKRFDEKRDIRFWKDNLDFSASLWATGDYVIMIVTRQNPHYLVEINDAVLAHNMREVFKEIWSEVIKTSNKTYAV